MLRLYTLSTCDSCRKAVAFLRARGVPFEEIAIRDTPPSTAELRLALAAGTPLRKLFNTSGREYRALGVGEKLAALSEAEAIALLAGNGNLVKRPFAVGKGTASAGFQEATWTAWLPSAAGHG
jgi:arsenate reductase